MRFENRIEAGRQLAQLLLPYRDERPVVLGLPRGGVPVGFEVAKALGAPLDVWVVRKVGAPYHEELGMGAVAQGGAVYRNERTMAMLGVDEVTFDQLAAQKQREVDERVVRFRGHGPGPELRDRTVILVDDGIATGGTVHAAIEALRTRSPRKIVLAVPVAPAESVDELAMLADDLVVVEAPEVMYAIGAWYRDFTQVPDEEVVVLLDRARSFAGAAAGAQTPEVDEREVRVESGPLSLPGTLTIPRGAKGLVLFAHGSGSSRFSPRNRWVAGELQRLGLATLLFDLLTEEEEVEDARTGALRFDIPLLARRLVTATDWALRFGPTRALRIGYFGSSTGAAAALIAAAKRPDEVGAVVSRGGRPDLAAQHLHRVLAPCLFIVGGEDTAVLPLNQQAYGRLASPKHLAVVDGATHLFEEPGALEQVAQLAGEWFTRTLGERAQPPARTEQPAPE